MRQKDMSLSAGVVILTFLLPSFVFAQWSGPSQAPTGGNTSAPLNTSSSAQSKVGSLTLNTGGSTNGLIVQLGNVGIGTTPVYKLDVNGDVINNGWYRSRGSTGWYNESYGGGWYMQDATWIRSYNSKPVYMSAGLDTGASSGINCSGSMGGSYNLQVCGASGVGASAFYYTSDKILKKNIEKIDGAKALDSVKRLRGVSFDWRDSGRHDLGVIAQEVESVYPELVKTDVKTGLKSVEYSNLIAPLIEAIKEQQKQIDVLKDEIESLKSR